MGTVKTTKAIVTKLSRLGDMCDHNRVVGFFINPVRKLWHNLGIGRYLHQKVNDSDPKRQQRQQEFVRFCDLHAPELQKLADMLEDDFSRRTLERVLAFRKSLDKGELKDIIVQTEYFRKEFFAPVQDEVFVDGGAYVGDTVREFLEFSGGVYNKIYAWEPDAANFAALKKNFRKMENVVCVPCGMWKEKTELCFRATGAINAKIVEDGAGQDVVKVPVDSIDNVCADDKVTFIKMDIEGSEMEALAGAVNVIRRDKPRLAICIYHKPEHLYEIPFWIRQTVPEYKLYIRHHSDTATETILYATV